MKLSSLRSVAIPVLAAAVFPSFSAKAQDLERPPITEGVSAIFNEDITSFVGLTVYTCTKDGHLVSVTANPVSPKDEIAESRQNGMTPEFDSVTRGMEMELRDHVAELELKALKDASRFGRTQQIPELIDRLRAGGFPLTVSGINLFIKDNARTCVIS